MKSKNLYVLVGCPGSGKSFYGRTVLSPDLGCAIVSRDEVRFSIIGEEEDYFSHETKVFNTFIKHIKEELNTKGICIADATHVTVASRNKLLRALNMNDINVHLVVMKTPLEVCMLRNSLRTGRERVPDSAIRHMYYSMEYPTMDENPLYKDITYITEGED